MSVPAGQNSRIDEAEMWGSWAVVEMVARSSMAAERRRQGRKKRRRRDGNVERREKGGKRLRMLKEVLALCLYCAVGDLTCECSKEAAKGRTFIKITWRHSRTIWS